MSRAILFSTFFILTLGVIFSLLFSFQYIKPVAGSYSNHSSKSVDIKNDTITTELESSWLKDISFQRSKEPYFFAITELEIKLN